MSKFWFWSKEPELGPSNSGIILILPEFTWIRVKGGQICSYLTNSSRKIIEKVTYEGGILKIRNVTLFNVWKQKIVRSSCICFLLLCISVRTGNKFKKRTGVIREKIHFWFWLFLSVIRSYPSLVQFLATVPPLMSEWHLSGWHMSMGCFSGGRLSGALCPGAICPGKDKSLGRHLSK